MMLRDCVSVTVWLTIDVDEENLETANTNPFVQLVLKHLRQMPLGNYGWAMIQYYSASISLALRRGYVAM